MPKPKKVTKPCWKLNYCPYGPLVEQFPVLPPIRKDAIVHNEMLNKQLSEGKYTGVMKKQIELHVKNFDPNKYPEKHSKSDLEKTCSIFGHTFPVFLVSENVVDKKEMKGI